MSLQTVGLQKEAYFFEKFCLTIRPETEWMELVESGNNVLVGYEVNKILSAFNAPIKFNHYGKLYGHATPRVDN